ncbi:MAG: hypothetical protein WBE34_15235 [Candidatus Nitrosopolaris sp.]
MIDPEITQLKARMTLVENMWIESERKLDILIKKIDGFTYTEEPKVDRMKEITYPCSCKLLYDTAGGIPNSVQSIQESHNKQHECDYCHQKIGWVTLLINGKCPDCRLEGQ